MLLQKIKIIKLKMKIFIYKNYDKYYDIILF